MDFHPFDPLRRNIGIFELPQVGHACARAWWQDAAEQEASAGRFSLQNDGFRHVGVI